MTDGTMVQSIALTASEFEAEHSRLVECLEGLPDPVAGEAEHHELENQDTLAEWGAGERLCRYLERSIQDHEQMLAGIMPKASSGDAKAVEAATKIHAELTKLHLLSTGIVS